jgi:hypothetical protein
VSQSDFSTDNAINAIEAVDEIFKALPKSKQMNFIGHLNDAMLFLESAKRKTLEPEKK